MLVDQHVGGPQVAVQDGRGLLVEEEHRLCDVLGHAGDGVHVEIRSARPGPEVGTVPGLVMLDKFGHYAHL